MNDGPSTHCNWAFMMAVETVSGSHGSEYVCSLNMTFRLTWLRKAGLIYECGHAGQKVSARL